MFFVSQNNSLHIHKHTRIMNLNNQIARKIFEGRYPYEMPFYRYLSLLEKGFELLQDAKQSIESYSELPELKAIRIALEYRFEVIRQTRRKQLNKAMGSIQNFATFA
jgi:hypothetical protein